jgi:uncharacterized protein YbjT (DUF2867 family)
MIGATGLVGSLLRERILGRPGAELHALVRRSSGRSHPFCHEHVLPPEKWPEAVASIGADTAVSALGTTMRNAGSEAAFRAVDYDMVLAFAAAARAARAGHMLTVSSVGADPASRNFYLRLKGEMEQALAALGFDRLDVLRPGLLVGKRSADRRLGERLGILVSPVTNLFLRGSLGRYAAIDARLVAAAAAACLDRSEPGVRVHENNALRRLAQHA